MMLMMIPVVMVVMACYGDGDDKVDIDPSTFLEHWSRISSTAVDLLSAAPGGFGLAWFDRMALNARYLQLSMTPSAPGLKFNTSR